MYRQIILLTVFVIFTVFVSNTFKTYNFDENRLINVEIKGEVSEEKAINVPLGSTFESIIPQLGLLNTSDISNISYLDVLYNNQIIEIPKVENCNLVSINSGSIAELSALPGIGKSIAAKIIEYRNEYGSFHNLDELMNVSGIGSKKYEKIKQYICL